MQPPIVVLALLITRTIACGSACVCQKADGSGLCIADIQWVHPFSEHDCRGWCHDRTCGGTTPGFFGETWKCRISKGVCDQNATEDHDLEYCGLHAKKYNNCEGGFDCPKT